MAYSEGLPLLQDPTSPRAKARLEAREAAKRQTRRRVIIVSLLATLVAVAGYLAVAKRVVSLLPAATLEHASPFAEVVAAYRATHDFDGVVQVRVNGSVAYQVAAGLADEEFGVPMPQDAIFPVGSNSKLFVAVALYQLQERGLVNLSEPVNAHLTQADFANFGFPSQTAWCPRVRGAARDAPCENITFVQLMHMGSGIGDSLNCDIVEPAYCHNTAENLVYYKGSLGPYVGIFINDPLVFKPDTNYSYANPNYYLLSYLVEKISRVPLAEYVQTQIADKIGLRDTYFDPYSGGRGVRRNYVQQYIHYYAQSSVVDAPGERLATAACSPYINSGAISGSGGFRSTVADMERWYLDLFENRGTASKVLSPESIRMIIERVNPVNPMYAQGVGVLGLRADGWPRTLAYCGGMKCCITCLQIEFPEHGTASSVLVAAFSNHMHYGFVDRAAFDAYHPNDIMMLPNASAMTVADGGGPEYLPRALLDAYLAPNTSTTAA